MFFSPIRMFILCTFTTNFMCIHKYIYNIHMFVCGYSSYVCIWREFNLFAATAAEFSYYILSFYCKIDIPCATDIIVAVGAAAAAIRQPVNSTIPPTSRAPIACRQLKWQTDKLRNTPWKPFNCRWAAALRKLRCV